MKNILIQSVFLLFSLTVAAQIQPHAIGLRLGGGDGIGSEISYQQALKNNNRLEADLGLVSTNNFNRMQITGLYQWVWNIQGALNWYAGLGGCLGQISYKNNSTNQNEMQLFVNGNIGIEYQLDIPVQISLDLRPAFGSSQFDNSSLALGIRYTF